MWCGIPTTIPSAVNKEGRRFVAEDAYHGRLAAFIMEQPDQTAWLIVNEENFAYPEAGHKLIDGWETIAQMERDLGVPQGSLERTLADYNRDAKGRVDRRFHKHADYLKPLDIGPWAAFDLSFKRSPYVFLTLGGLRTSLNGEALDASGAPLAGLYAVGACAATCPGTERATPAD